MVEELDPFLEENIRLQGVQVDGGKDILPLCGEFNPGLVARLLSEAGVPGVDEGLLVDGPRRRRRTCPTARRHSAPAARTAACSSRCAACAPS